MKLLINGLTNIANLTEMVLFHLKKYSSILSLKLFLYFLAIIMTLCHFTSFFCPVKLFLLVFKTKTFTLILIFDILVSVSLVALHKNKLLKIYE